MRYHFDKPQRLINIFGTKYRCNHPIYDECTLYNSKDGRGLAVIQQRRAEGSKTTYWGPIDTNLIDYIFLAPGFKKYFDEHAGQPKEGLYPTVAVRQIMWALRMKPLQKNRWETSFDRKEV